MTEETTLYIPKGARTLDTIHSAQIRLGIQGPPKTGKTWASLTFPNPVVLNFNRGLGAHTGRADVVEIPFYDASFIATIVKSKPNEPPNKRDALEKWLEKEGLHLKHNQTLIFDSSTDIEVGFESQESLEPVYTKSGELDKFATWRHKIEYFGRLMDIIKSFNCNIIYIVHEQQERDSKGDLNGKLKPLLSGQYADKLASNFTDWFRQHAGAKKDLEKIDDKILKLWGFKSKDEYRQMQDKYPGNTIYLWQTSSDDLSNCGTSSLIDCPHYIPATYESFTKYTRKSSI